MKNTSTCAKSEKTDAEDDEEILSPIRPVEDSPQKNGESTSKKLVEETPAKGKEKENKTEGADLMIAEEKEYDKVRISDYVKLFRFSYGAWTMGLYIF